MRLVNTGRHEALEAMPKSRKLLISDSRQTFQLQKPLQLGLRVGNNWLIDAVGISFVACNPTVVEGYVVCAAGKVAK